MSVDLEQMADELIASRATNTRGAFPFFRTLELGDAYLVECAPEDRKRTQMRLCMAKWHYEPLLDAKFKTRRVEGGVMVERIT